jgi:hypothetical protein
MLSRQGLMRSSADQAIMGCQVTASIAIAQQPIPGRWVAARRGAIPLPIEVDQGWPR